MKFRIPISLFSCFSLSKNNATRFVLPMYSDNFVYNASSLWNVFSTSVDGPKIPDFAGKMGYMKSKIKEFILRRQRVGDELEWDSETNFNLR